MFVYILSEFMLNRVHYGGQRPPLQVYKYIRTSAVANYGFSTPAVLQFKYPAVCWLQLWDKLYNRIVMDIISPRKHLAMPTYQPPRSANFCQP